MVSRSYLLIFFSVGLLLPRLITRDECTLPPPRSTFSEEKDPPGTRDILFFSPASIPSEIKTINPTQSPVEIYDVGVVEWNTTRRRDESRDEIQWQKLSFFLAYGVWSFRKLKACAKLVQRDSTRPDNSATNEKSKISKLFWKSWSLQFYDSRVKISFTIH